MDSGKYVFEKPEQVSLEDLKANGWVKAAYRFPNNMVATYDFNDEQIPELQGEFSHKLYSSIVERSCALTSFHGF